MRLPVDRHVVLRMACFGLLYTVYLGSAEVSPIPFDNGDDPLLHAARTRDAMNGTLLVDRGESPMFHHPPLYYAVAAPVVAWVGDSGYFSLGFVLAAATMLMAASTLERAGVPRVPAVLLPTGLLLLPGSVVAGANAMPDMLGAFLSAAALRVAMESPRLGGAVMGLALLAKTTAGPALAGLAIADGRRGVRVLLAAALVASPWIAYAFLSWGPQAPSVLIGGQFVDIATGARDLGQTVKWDASFLAPGYSWPADGPHGAGPVNLWGRLVHDAFAPERWPRYTPWAAVDWTVPHLAEAVALELTTIVGAAVVVLGSFVVLRRHDRHEFMLVIPFLLGMVLSFAAFTIENHIFYLKWRYLLPAVSGLALVLWIGAADTWRRTRWTLSN